MSMFIEGIDSNLYISDPSQLVEGMELWHVGQGGITSVNKPYFLGYLVEINKRMNADGQLEDEPNWIMYKRPGADYVSDGSMNDKHILPQRYNNWYVCDSEEKAQAIYDYMIEQWNSDPSYEEERQRFSDECRRWDEIFDRFDDYEE